jgi:hypothetical protein
MTRMKWNFFKIVSKPNLSFNQEWTQGAYSALATFWALSQTNIIRPIFMWLTAFLITSGALCTCSWEREWCSRIFQHHRFRHLPTLSYQTAAQSCISWGIILNQLINFSRLWTREVYQKAVTHSLFMCPSWKMKTSKMLLKVCWSETKILLKAHLIWCAKETWQGLLPMIFLRT